MNPGDPVEVRMVWASNGRLQEPSRRWFKGYEFVAIEVVRDEKVIRALEKQLSWDKNEGYVVRVADSFTYGQFKTSIAKFVREGHVTTTKHWRAGRHFTPNELFK